MIESAIGFALRSVADLIDPHPDLAKKLVTEVIDVLSGFRADKPPNPEAVAAAVSGLAAARSNAVQTALRRAPNPPQSGR